MISTILFSVLIAVAAAFNALCDSIENENFYESVFRNLNEKFWYKRTSWKYAKKIFGYPVDAWHLSKSAMIICLSFAAAVAPPLPIIVNVVVFGIVWILSFNLFYNKVFLIYKK